MATVDGAERPPGITRLKSVRLTDLVYRLRAYGIVAALLLLIIVATAMEPRFLERSGGQHHPRQLDDPGPAHARRGDGDHHAERRPVGRRRARPGGLRLGDDVRSPARGLDTTAIVIAFLVGIGIGIACGVVNGALTTIGRIPSLVVTLAHALHHPRDRDPDHRGGQVVASSLPDAFFLMSLKSVVHVPYLAIAVAVVICIGAYYMRSFRSGRDMYAIGSHPARPGWWGFPSARRVFTAFVVSGGLAGAAGVLWASKYGTLDSTAGSGYELQVIAAVVIGGVAIFGGSGSVIGAALGALLLSTILAALYVVGVSPFWTQAIEGMLILIAISIDRLISVRLTASLRKRRLRESA